MKAREIYRNLSAFPPVFIRLDGRAFHRVSYILALEKPFDAGFSGAMSSVCRALMEDSGLNPVFAYTFSDEINLYFDLLPFNGRVEKLDSVSASFAASALTIALGVHEPLAFDARIVAVTPDRAAEYLVWRQSEAWRNHINAYSQWALIAGGSTSSEAADALLGMREADMHELMYEKGINLAKTPAWQRRGILVHRIEVEKEGYNPVKDETVVTTRSRVSICDEPPLFGSPEGRRLISSLVKSP